MNNEKRETLAEQIKRLIKGGSMSQPGDRSSSRGDRKTRATQDIVIGLDFGTSCTKVVVQDPSRRTAWAVPFNELAVKGNAYLLPTKLILCDDGTVGLSGKGRAILDLKVRLMAAPDKPFESALVGETALSPRQLCAAYLALVLRRVRLWFSTSRADIYGASEIVWQLNLGVPSSTLSDSLQTETFRQVAQTAWALSMSAEVLKCRDVIATDQASCDKGFACGLDAGYLNVYPEIAAEATGYARSDARQPGLHLMIDIGASTLDVTTFILFDREGSDNFSFLVTDVQKYGSFFLHRRRVKSLEKLIGSRFDPLDMFRPTPDDVREMLPTTQETESIDQRFSGDCRAVLGDVIVTTKSRRAGSEPQFRRPNPAPLPVFVCGGGSLLKFYKGVVDAFDGSLRPSMAVGAFDVQPLPVPQRLNAPGLKSGDYHRLAVAYGLSFRHLDLAAVIPPTRIPDVASAQVSMPDKWVSKDMV